jgi:branched-chain amino acid transport system permease protein
MSQVANFVEQLFNGLTVGMVYVLLAAGLSIIFGVMDVINFSHGELFALGAYFAVTIVTELGAGGFWVALLVAPVLVGIIGLVIERLTLRPLYGRDPLYHILLTFGLVLIIQDLIVLGWGRQQQHLAVPEVLTQPVEVLGIQLSAYSYFMIAAGTVLAFGTWLLLNRTKYGMIVRAGAQDRGMVRNVGINIDRYYTLIFGFGAALAAVAGIILGGYLNVNPTMGGSVIIPAFIIVVLGGLGSFRGAVFGGLLVGVTETLLRTYVPALEGLIVFLVMIVVLLIRPQGLFGSESEEGGEDGDLYVGSHGGVLTRATRTKLGALAVGLLALAPPILVATTGNSFYVSLLNEVLIWAIFALSLDFVMGYAGLVPLGHTLFYGVGAYAAALVMLHVTSSFLIALAGAILLCAVIAWVVGSLSIRVSGVYFAMITLAFAELGYQLAIKLDFTGGSDGLLGFDPVLGVLGAGVPLGDVEITLAGLTLGAETVFFYLALGLAVAALLLARRIMHAPFGSVLQSIAESEERATFIGYDVTTYKRRAFVISGGMAGLAGGLLAINPNTFVISPGQTLHWIHSGEVIVMTILGGMGTLFGPMLGAGVYLGLEELLLSYTEQWRMILGTIFVLFVIFVPRGLVSLPSLLKTRFGKPEDGEPGAVVTEQPEVSGDD